MSIKEKDWKECKGCGRPLNPIEALADYCQACAEEGHKEATGKE